MREFLEEMNLLIPCDLPPHKPYQPFFQEVRWRPDLDKIASMKPGAVQCEALLPSGRHPCKRTTWADTPHF
jgi:hypothetical protein